MTDAETSSPDQLIALAKRGDRDAFGKLYQLLKTSVWRWAYHAIQDGDAAEEIAGDCFLAMINQLDDIPDDLPAVSAWVRRVAQNKSCDLIRRNQSLRKGLHALAMQASSSGESHSIGLERQETSTQILAALGQLPDEYQIAIQWRYVDELHVQEIADRLNQSLSATNSLLYRARVKLRATLSMRLEGSPVHYQASSATRPQTEGQP